MFNHRLQAPLDVWTKPENETVIILWHYTGGQLNVVLGVDSTSNTAVATLCDQRSTYSHSARGVSHWLLGRGRSSSLAELISGVTPTDLSDVGHAVKDDLAGFGPRTWQQKPRVPQWLVQAHLRGAARAKRGELARDFREINSLLVSRNWQAIDELLVGADVTQLSPELLVGMARAVSSVSGHLSNWRSYVSRVKLEFQARSLPADEILKGLL